MIKKIIIHNLKSIESLTVDLKDRNSISGRNGVGKSTIKEAITFALYGKINNTDRIDEAIRNGQKDAKVTLILDKGGKDIIISRSRSTKGSTLEINGRLSEQADINALFGLYDYFVSGNFVGEFMKYSDVEKRQLILNMYEPLDRETIFKKITGEDPLGYDLNNLDATEKQIKIDLKTKENSRILLSSQKETLNADLFRLKDDLNVLKEKALVDNSKRLLELKVKLDEISKSKPDQYSFTAKPADTSEVERAISKLTLELMNLKEPQDPGVEALQMSITSLKGEYNNLKSSTVCPTCKRKYDDLSHINSKLVEIQLSIKGQFEMWKAKKESLDVSIAIYNEKKDDINLKLKELSANKEELVMAVEMMQSELDDKFERAISLWNTDTEVLRQELDKLSALQQEFDVNQIRIDSAKQNISDLEFKIEKMVEQIKQTDTSVLERVVKAFGPKGIKFQELLSQQKKVNSTLPENLTIEFMRENKTTEGFKPVFNVIMDGVSYPWLSTGMKILADLYLLRLFKGTFIVIDNFESYTGEIPEDLEDRQMLLLSAIDQDMKVETTDKEVKKPVKTAKKPVKKAAKKSTKKVSKSKAK